MSDHGDARHGISPQNGRHGKALQKSVGKFINSLNFFQGHRRIHFAKIVQETETNSKGEMIEEKSEAATEGEKQEDTSVDDHRILMAETENFQQQSFETTDELKAITQEVIKTIRDIIVSRIIL